MQVSQFESVIEYLNARCEDDIESGGGPTESNSRYSYNPDMQVAVMDIEGPLTYKPITFMGMDCGGASYQTLKEDFTYLVEQGVKTVAFNADSPGGEAFQLFPTASYIRKLADANGVKIITYVDGLAASAMYGLASISDEIIMAPSAEVGSIGVVVRLMNDSKALEMNGYQRTFIKAGASKVPFGEDGEFRKEFLEDIQDKVDVLYEEFTGFVAEHRNMSVDKVRSTEAKTFLPEKALQLGLADKVMSVEDFYMYLADTAQANKGSNNSVLKNKLFSLSKEDNNEMTQLADMQSQLEALTTELSTAQLAVAELASTKEAFATLQAAFTEKETALAAALEQVKQMEAVKEQMKAQARTDKLSAVMAADKVEAVQTSLATLSDEAFETVLAGFAQQKQALEASELMQELGGEGGEPEAKTQEEDKARLSTEALIKQRLGLK
jgi:ClpP class serine protease